MIVYVETNFVLELTFQRDESGTCDELLKLANDGHVSLVLPGFCLSEAYGALGRRARRRAQLHQEVLAEVRELIRSSLYQAPAKLLEPQLGLLRQSIEGERQQVYTVLNQILSAAETISLEQSILQRANELYEGEILGDMEDALVFASILQHLQAVPDDTEKCFLTRNSRDFDTPDITTELARYKTKLLFKFADGLGYIQNQLSLS